MADRKVAIDFETYLICEEEGVAPRPVCLSFFDGKDEGILLGDDIPKFLLSLGDGVEIIAHNIKFEFSVILKHYPELTDWVMKKLEDDLVWCTLISEQIINLGRQKKIFKFSLDVLVMQYLGIDISEDKKNPSAWRTRYSELVNIPLKLWPKEAVDYSIMDSKYAFEVRKHQQTSHTDSVRAAVLLGQMAERGFYKRKDYVADKLEELDSQMKPMRDVLEGAGLGEYNKKGIFKRKTKAIREYLSANFNAPVETDKGNIATDKKSLAVYEGNSLIELWSKYMHLEKLRNTYIKVIYDANEVVRTDYNVVVDTCRTSSRSSSLVPALNMQNIPRGDGIRECFSGRPGFTIAAIDYSSLELVCAAQQLYNLYGTSAMMDALNYGDKPVDLHSMLGSKLLSIEEGREVSYEEFVTHKKDYPYSKFRTMAKPLNLGYPGGIGAATMSRTAKDAYGVTITIKEAQVLKKLFFKAYPELGRLLSQDINKLSTGSFMEYSDSKMVPEYFYMVKGIKRRGCTYNSACNGILMQTPAALGTKRMLWRLLQRTVKDENIFPLAFIHDEVLFEIKDDEKTHDRVAEMAYLMVDSMKEVLPDVRVAVEADVGPIWKKDGMGWSKLYWRD